MPLYEVTVERTQQVTLWIDAPDRDSARIDAAELADALPGDDWEFVERELSVVPQEGLPAWVDVVWVGGEDGSWMPRSLYLAEGRA